MTLTEEKKMGIEAPAVVAIPAIVDSTKADAAVVLAQVQPSPSDAKPLEKAAPILEKK